MHADLAARREDWVARAAHEIEEKSRRRLSVAMRLDSWREQRMAEEKLDQQRRLEEERDARLREEDREAVAELRRKERDDEMADRLNGSLVL